MERGQWDTAESLMAQAVKACPVDANAQRYYADVLWQRGAREQALTHAKEALQLSGGDPAVAVRVGEMQLAMGNTDEAMKLASQAIDIDPRLASAWGLRGRVEQMAGKLDASLADYLRALQYAPADRDLLAETADIYRRLNRPQRALATLASLRETYQNGDEPAQLLQLEAQTLLALNRPEDAVVSYIAAIQRSPQSPDLLAQLAELQWQTGQMADAQRNVQQALAISPNHAGSLAVYRQKKREFDAWHAST